jgi:hypothetical protein
MALPTDELRSEYAAAAPVYVRAAGASYELVDTASDEALGTFDTPKQALKQALEREDVEALVKRENLRTNGEPDGVWRWLDASATEDEPIGKSRIDDASLWEMAAGLNARKSAIPINGGGAPEGYVASEPHGDAKNKDGAHPANGWAHLGLIVVETDERTHLYLYGELLPEVAKEVDRGRLAYGSIFFAFESADEENNYAVSGATLISHALTNDPAVTTLVAGSERHGLSGANVAYRSRKMSLSKHETNARDAKQTPKARVRAALDHLAATNQRGPIGEMQTKVAVLLGVTEMDLASNPWAMEDSVHALKIAAQFEKKIEASAPPVPPAPPSGEVAAEARSAGKLTISVEHDGESLAIIATRDVVAVAAGRAAGDRRSALAACIRMRLTSLGKRAEELSPEDDAKIGQLLAWAREVLGKPEATVADVLAELDARKEEVGKVLGTDTPPSAPAAEAEPEKKAAAPEEPEKKDEPPAEKPPTPPAAEEEEDEDAKERASLRARLDVIENREWLRSQIAARKLDRSHGPREAVGAKEFEDLVEGAAKSRDLVIKILDAKGAPPVGNPLDDVREPAPDPKSHAEASAEGGPIWLEAEKIERARDPNVPKHVIAGRANRLIEQRYPTLR